MLSDGDAVMFFSSNCPSCKISSATWSEMLSPLQQVGRKLVLINTNPVSGDLAGFVQESGLVGCPLYTLATYSDLFELGIRGVPHYIELGDGLKVTWQTDAVRLSPSHKAIGRVLGVDTVIAGLARQLFGQAMSDLTLDNEHSNSTVTIAHGVINSKRYSIIVGQGAMSNTSQVECALGVDEGGFIRWALPIIWSAGLWRNEAEEPCMRRLIGMTLRDAIQYAHAMQRASGGTGHVWSSVRAMLEAMRTAAKNV